MALFVCINRRGSATPFNGFDATLTSSYRCVGANLEELGTWSPEQTLMQGPVLAILVNLSDIQPQMDRQDTWATGAWRATINALVTRCVSATGKAPVVLAHAREPSWELAEIAVGLGSRELCLDSELVTRIGRMFPDAFLKAAEIEAQNKVLALTPRTLRGSQFPDEVSGVIADIETISQGEAPSKIPANSIPFPIEGLEGQSSAIEAIRNLIRKVSPSDAPVWITGATGSGKERVARSIHRYSPRAASPFVVVACASLSPSLIESELFGHTAGAFTGATQDRIGLFESAQSGTVFLDGLTDLSLDAQVKLLRVIQEGSFTPVGANESRALNVRWISSSQRDVSDLVADGQFREDLLFRLKVIEVELPALHERRSDLPELSKSILKKLAKKTGQSVLTVSNSVFEKFLLYAWPGNIRELENVLERAATLCWGNNRSTIEANDLPENIQYAEMHSANEHHLKEAVHRFEREYIAATVRRLGGAKEEAAETLGLSLATLYRKLSA